MPLPLAASVPPRSIFLASSSSFLLSRFKFFPPVSPRFYALHRFPSPLLRPRPSLTIFLLKLPSPLTLSIRMPFSTATAAAAAATPNPDTVPATTMSKKKARRESPEFILRRSLDMCSKNGDLPEALRLYDAARAAATPLSLHLFNVLLYLCSSSSAGPLGLDRGFEIYRQMGLDGVTPNEATFTSLARLAAAKEDPDLAFDLVKEMASAGIPPKLRSFGPALFGFCKKGEVEKAHEVEAYMLESNVEPEETELAELLHANVQKGRGDDVYRLLHRLRTIVRRVSESTADTIESWLNTEAAEEVGVEKWDIEKVKKGIVEGGGGWHGQGWLGKGRWNVGRTQMDENGVCRRCGEKLVCIDIDPAETEDFANSLAKLASEREARADFTGFKVCVFTPK